jgi:hypothetical protein
MPRRTYTMKDVALLRQLYSDKQLLMATEFQRNSVWPRAAKAYLIDTILTDRPIPVLYFRRVTSAQTGRSSYEVIDGQQRLRAIFEFLDDRFHLMQTTDKHLKGKRFSELSSNLKSQILSYDLYIEELTAYSDNDIRDMFVRMNKYVVKLSPQEIRHAGSRGKFADFVESIAKWPFWKENKVFTPHQIARMRAVEFSAEVAILFIEGPQDKKQAVDLYYERYQKSVPFRGEVEAKLKTYLDWIKAALPNLSKSRFRKPVDLYSLCGALDQITNQSVSLTSLDPTAAGSALEKFERALRSKSPSGSVARYIVGASRQTDNIAPRMTRIEILTEVIQES